MKILILTLFVFLSFQSYAEDEDIVRISNTFDFRQNWPALTSEDVFKAFKNHSLSICFNGDANKVYQNYYKYGEVIVYKGPQDDYVASYELIEYQVAQGFIVAVYIVKGESHPLDGSKFRVILDRCAN